MATLPAGLSHVDRSISPIMASCLGGRQWATVQCSIMNADEINQRVIPGAGWGAISASAEDFWQLAVAEGDNEMVKSSSLAVTVDLSLSMRKSLQVVSCEAVRERMRDQLSLVKCKIASHEEALAALRDEEKCLGDEIEENKRAAVAMNQGNKKIRTE